MKNYLLIPCLLLLVNLSFSQTVTISHGGTGGITTNPIDRTGSPATSGNMSGVVWYLYTKSDINAAGLNSAANINSIAFEKVGGSTCTGTASGCGTIGQTNVKIYMRSTSAESLSLANGGTSNWNSVLSNFTLVFDGVFDHRGAYGWKTRTLTTNFFWDNNSNIEIIILNESNTILNNTDRPSWRSTLHTTAPRIDQTRIGRVDGNTLPTNAGLTGNKAHIRFGYTACTAPTSPSFSAGATSLCVGGTSTYIASATGGTSVSYSILSGGASINSSTGAVSSVTSNFTVRATISNACGSVTVDRSVTVSSAPTSPSFSAGATSLCSGATSTYTASATGGTSVSYSILSGGASINSSTGAVSSVTSNFTVRATISNSCGSVTVDRSVTVTSTPTNTTTTTGICLSGSKDLSGSPAGGTFSIASGGGSIVGTTYTPASTGDKTIRYTLNGCFADVVFNVAADPVAPTITPSPNSTLVCEGINVSATFTGGTGGVSGNNVYDFRTNDGSGWSGFTSYTPGNNISTNGLAVVQIRARRTTGQCANAVNTHTFNIQPKPTSGTLQHANNTLQICSGETISANNLTAPTIASGTLNVVWYCGVLTSGTPGPTGIYGNWVESNSAPLNFTTSAALNTAAGGGSGNGLSLSNYNPLDDFPSATQFRIIRRAYATECGQVCAGGCVDQTFYVTINNNPNITASLDDICLNGTKSLSATPAGGVWSIESGGGNIASNTYTPASTGQKTLRYTVNNCFSEFSFNVAPSTQAGDITPSPNATEVCVGTNVSATFTAGSGGISGNDVYEIRTDDGSGWSSFSTYTPGDNVSTTGLIRVQIRTRRISTGCTNNVNSHIFDVIANPTVAAITGTQNVCVNGTTTFANTTGGGTWSTDDASIATVNGSGVVTGVGSGTTNITYTVVSGICTTSVSRSATVSICNNSWTGLNGTAWGDGGNWSTGTVPSIVDQATIPTTPIGGNFPQISGTFEVDNLTIEPGATIIINTGGALTVSGTLTNNGTFTIQSDGYLVQTVGSTLSGTGIFHAQRQMTGSSNQGVRFVGPLITNATVGSFGFPAGVINGTGQLLPAPNCNPNNTAANSPWSRVLQLNESLTHPSNCYVTLWQALGNGAPLTPGRGYQMWTSGGQTLTFSGTVNNGDVNFNNLPQTNLPPLNGANNVGTVDRGWHLVSNPYPSPIQLTGAQLTAMGFEAQIQRFSTTGGTAGTWVASNPLTTVTLAPGQGFQVRTASIATAANFQLTNAFRTANPATFFNNDEWCDYHLDIKVTGSNFEDFTSVYFIDGATGNFDISYDANKWLNHDRNNLFTVSTDNQNLTYNGQALLNDYREIPMHFEVKTNGNYNFDFSFVESFPAGSVVFLKDNKTNTTTNLREVSNYSFTSVTTDDANRFILIFYPQLSLTTQTADCNNSGKIIVEANGLDWTYNVEDENQAVVAQGTVSNSNQTEILLPTGSYLLNIQLNNSTYSDAIENIVIEGLTQSIANFVMSSNEILVGESISFESTSSNAVAVEWLFGDGFSAIEENPIHYYNNAGWYEVSLKAISENGCESIKTDNVWVRNETLSIDEVKDTNKFSLYSNGKSIFVNIPEINKEGLQHLQLKIYRLDGSLLNVYDLNGKIGQQTIKTDLLQNVYLAVILSEKDLYLTAKIFID